MIEFLLTVANAAPPMTATKAAVDTSIVSAILSASLTVQLTLLLLVVLSILSWSIAILKWNQFRSIRESTEIFLVRFWRSTSLQQMSDEAELFKANPLAKVFKAALVEMKKTPESDAAPLFDRNESIERSLKKAADQEILKMESQLNILATTGSTSPFIGLFGTVWGIMSSFHKIGQTGSASLAVVAPGISEALFTTAVGLLAAIPAVVFYNHFIGKIKKEETELNSFMADFLNVVKRKGIKEN